MSDSEETKFPRKQGGEKKVHNMKGSLVQVASLQSFVTEATPLLPTHTGQAIMQNDVIDSIEEEKLEQAKSQVDPSSDRDSKEMQKQMADQAQQSASGAQTSGKLATDEDQKADQDLSQLKFEAILKSQKSQKVSSANKNKRESLQGGESGRSGQEPMTGRQSARSVDDDVKKATNEPDEPTPDKIVTAQLNRYMDMTPDRSLLQSAKSLHTKENKRQSILAQNDNADLVDDLGIQKEILLTRNQPRQKINLTAHDDVATHLNEDGIIVSDRIELQNEKSINLTDFKSFQAPSEYQQNMLSIQGKDHFMGLFDKKSHLNMATLEGANKNLDIESVLQTDRNDLKIDQDGQAAQSQNTAALPQINLAFNDKITNQNQDIEVKSQKKTNKKVQSNGKRLSQSPQPKEQSQNLKPFIFGKSKTSATAFVSNLQNSQTPNKKEDLDDLILNMKQKKLNLTVKAINFDSLVIAGQRSSTKQKMSKQDNTNGNDPMPEINGRGLIGKNQPPLTRLSVHSGFRPNKIKKSKRNLLVTTHSLSPVRTGTAIDGMSNKQDAAIVNMTPMNIIPKNLINQAELAGDLQSSQYKQTHGENSELESMYKNQQNGTVSDEGQKVYQKVADTQLSLPADLALTAKQIKFSPKQPTGKKVVLNVQAPPSARFNLMQKRNGDELSDQNNQILDNFQQPQQKQTNLVLQGDFQINLEAQSRMEPNNMNKCSKNTQLITQQTENLSSKLQQDQEVEMMVPVQHAMQNHKESTGLLTERNQLGSDDFQPILVIASRTEESVEDLLQGHKLLSNTNSQLLINQQSRQKLLTSMTQLQKSSSGNNENNYASNVESSIVNIECLQASQGQTHEKSQQMTIYADKVMNTQQSSEPMNASNTHLTQGNQQTIVPILSIGSESKGAGLPKVVEMGESSTGNLDTLERSNVYTQSNNRSVDANFGQLVKERLDQKNSLNSDSLPMQDKHSSSVGENVNKMINVVVINEEKAESANDPDVPLLPNIQFDHIVQQTDRPFNNSKLGCGDESSVTVTHQHPQYMMSNRYSNRESMQLAKDGGNKSYSFGLVNMGLQPQVLNINEETKFATTNTKKQLKPQKKIDVPRVEAFKQFKDDAKNKTASSVSLFKKSKKQKHSSNSPNQNMASKDLSPIHAFKINQLRRKQTHDINSSTSQENDNKHKSAIQNPHKIFDNSIEVEDQNQMKHTETSLPLSQMNLKMKQNVSWQNTGSMKEYGYYVQNVQQFDEMPPPSSTYFSKSRGPEPDNSQQPTRQVTENNLSSPKLTEFSGQAVSQMQVQVKVQTDKYADLLQMTDPQALENRLKSLLYTKQLFQTDDKATPGIEITNEEDKDIMVAIQSNSLTNVKTQPLGQNEFDHRSSDNFRQSMDRAYQTHNQAMTQKDGGVFPSDQQQNGQQRYNLFNVPPLSNRSKKPQTAGGTTVFQKTSTLLQGMTTSGRQKKKWTVTDKYPVNLRMSALTKPSTANEKLSGRMSHQMAKTQPFGLSLVSSEKNMIASTMGVLQRNLKSGKMSVATATLTPQIDPQLDITGKNPLKKFDKEIVQINLIKWMKIILDPSAQSVNLYKAGYNFIKLLFGENYRPNETEVSQIVHFICSNPSIPIDNLIRVSTSVSDQQKEQLNQKIAVKSQVSRHSVLGKKVGFGRAISEQGTSTKVMPETFNQTGYLTLGAQKQANNGKPKIESEMQQTEYKNAKEKQSMKLNAISRRMIQDHKKKKDELKMYQTKILTRQIEELRQNIGSNIYSEQMNKNKSGSRSLDNCLTPLRSNKNEISQCSTFDNITPDRVDHITGANTYITQMAQVDMEMKKKTYDKSDLDQSNSSKLPLRSNSELQQQSQLASKITTPHEANENKTAKKYKKRQTPPLPPSIATASKLSLLLNAQDNGLKTYIEAKNRINMASQLNTLSSKKNKKFNIVNRMVPSEQTQLTEMLHQYIQAHKLRSASDVRKHGGNNGSFSLVTGQSDAIKTQYSAVTMHPKEQVNKLLKYRDELRKLARDSNRIGSNKAQMQILQSVVDGPCPNNFDNNMALFAGEENNIYEQRRAKVMNQFKTIEKIKQMETGNRNKMPQKFNATQSQKQFVAIKNSRQVGSEELTSFVQDSGISGEAHQHSFPALPKNLYNNDLDSGDEGKILVAREQKEEALTKHYENIEKDVNQEPAMIYKKNNLLLEKIILDRALNKVQKRRFIRSNMPK